MVRVKVKEYGMEEVTQILKNIDKYTVPAHKRSMERIKKMMIKKLFDHLNAQDLGWRPLSARYNKKKTKQYGSSGLLIASEFYRDNIAAESGDRWAKIGVPALNYPNGTSLDVVAKVHEYGSAGSNIPARPLYFPTGEEIVKWLKRSKWIPRDVLTEILKDFPFKKKGDDKKGGESGS